MATKSSVSPQLLDRLNQQFGNYLDFEIIYSVALANECNLKKSVDILTELTSHAGFEKPKKKDKKPRSPKKITTMSHQETYINETIALIKRCYRVLVIMRGLPGSGKSTLARQIVKASLETDDFEPFIFSADDYFVVNGVYRYDPARLQDAHRYIQYQASEAMRKAISPVIIDNTNTQLWEMKPYAVRAVQCGYIIRIIEPMTPWAFNDKELARRNIHGVPRVKLKDMLERYEKNISTERLMQLLSLSYKNVKPPQLRAFPPIVSSYSDNKMVCDNSFKSDEAAEVLYNSDNDDICKIQTLSVDDMLSCNGFNAEVLEPCLSEWTSPYLQGETIPLLPEKDEEALASNVDKKEKSVCSNVDLSAWGVAEHALRSWELYTPISDEFVENTTPLNSEDEIKPELVDSETNTCKDDFALANGPEVLGIKILSTTNRDISANLPNIVLNKPRKKIMLDQSSWVTEDFLLDNLIGEDRGANLEQLSSIFPNTPKSYLSEILDKCKGNLNWAIDLLCEDKGQIAPEQEIPEPPSEPEIINSEDITDIEMVEVPKMIEDPPMTCNKVDNNVADGLLELKKKFEEGIHIAKEFYSEHVYKIKQARMNHTDAPQPSTSKTESFEMVTSETNGMSDSDTDISKSSDTRMSSSSDENEQEMVELNLGETLIGELENKLQEPSFVYPKGFQPIVQIPVNLARQLYAFYIESVYQQMDAQNEVLDAMLKEDEEFAKRLQQEEENQLQQKSNKTEDLKDIINEQYAMSLYQKDVDQWKNLTPDDLASKLTKQKLYEHFPHIDKSVLIEVWQAHGNNYKETVESILLSDPSCAVISGPGVFEPPLSDSLVQEMKEDYQRSQEATQETEQPRTAQSYREEASMYLQQRQYFYEKAQQATMKKMFEVASYYSKLAQMQTQHYEKANGFAASTFLNEHSKRLENFFTLDLHFLYVKEAIPALDMFIDTNIRLLGDSQQSQTLFVITGRGKNSSGGVSKLKPAVKGRLKKRKLNFCEMNPGLLKIKIHQNSLITSNLT